MEGVIEKVNTLLELCSDIPSPINIPQIVVVGAQSSGKSSILENIVGSEILPRGTGMVTRRPLMIQIVSTQSDTYCTFGHSPDKKYSLEEVQEEIEKETERILDRKNDVSAIPIVMKVHKKDTLPITLIDLPGLIKIRSEGQPEGIVKKIEELVRSYIQNNNTIILAVTPATTDIASSDALMIAREVDPSLDRTICVLTKIDLMDPGTDLVNVLQGRIVKTALGFIPVICRGEKSLKERIGIGEALEREGAYFSNHPSYVKNSKYCGIPYLIVRLHDILRKSIVKSTPYLQDRISYLLGKVEREIDTLGGAEGTDERQIIMQIITEVAQEIERRVSGTSKNKSKYLSREIVDGARISYTLDELFYNSIYSLELFDVSETEIENVLRNTSGIFGGSNTSSVIKHFISYGIDRIQPHCVQIASKVFLEMQSIVEICIDGNIRLNRFPKLKVEICKSITTLLKEHLNSSVRVIKEFLQWNSIYIRKERKREGISQEEQPEGIEKSRQSEQSSGVISAVQMVSTNSQSSLNSTPSMSSSVHSEISLIKQSITEQILSLKRTVTEQIPKIVVLEIVHKSIVKIQNKLIEDLYVIEIIPELLKEEQKTKEKRESLKQSLISLERAREIANTL